MNEHTYTHVIGILENYENNNRRIAVLRYELKHAAHITQEDMIEMMAYNHNEGSRPQSGGHADRTFDIATNYERSADKLNKETLDDISAQLTKLEQERERLLYYVSLLPKRQAKVLELYYFESLALDQIAQDMNLSTKTLRKLRNEAVDMLAELYVMVSKSM